MVWATLGSRTAKEQNRGECIIGILGIRQASDFEMHTLGLLRCSNLQLCKSRALVKIVDPWHLVEPMCNV